MINKKQEAKILFCDIEATNLDANFGYILCIGYKWAHEKKAKVISITDFSNHKKDCTSDVEVLKAFRPIYEAADIVVWHYGERFDLPYIQTRMLMNGMKVMPEASSVDTWKIAKYKLKLNSNRLDTVLKALECKYHKSPVDGKMWIRATAGDPKAIKYVVDHCYYDIMVLEEVYNKIKGLCPTHPKTTRVEDEIDRICGVCGKQMQKAGIRRCVTKCYIRLYCHGCGHWQKGALITNKKVKKVIIKEDQMDKKFKRRYGKKKGKNEN